METRSFVPTWRACPDPVELVVRPTSEWFAGRKAIRFALFADGELVFGDAFTVLHQDICRAQSVAGAPAIIVGSCRQTEAVWRAHTVQYFGSGGGNEDRLRWARSFLRELKSWVEAISAMGQDPLKETEHEWYERTH